MSVKIERFTNVEAKKLQDAMPNKKAGKWKELLKELHEKNEGVRVTNISRGSAYALAKTARELGMSASTTTDKAGTTVIVTMPEKKLAK